MKKLVLLLFFISCGSLPDKAREVKVIKASSLEKAMALDDRLSGSSCEYLRDIYPEVNSSNNSKERRVINALKIDAAKMGGDVVVTSLEETYSGVFTINGQGKVYRCKKNPRFLVSLNTL